MVLQIHDILKERKADHTTIPIIPEIRDSLTVKNCTTVEITDFINLAGLSAQLLAMVAYQPRMMDMLDEIFSDTDRVSFAMRKLEAYAAEGTPVPDKISFFEARMM